MTRRRRVLDSDFELAAYGKWQDACERADRNAGSARLFRTPTVSQGQGTQYTDRNGLRKAPPEDVGATVAALDWMPYSRQRRNVQGYAPPLKETDTGGRTLDFRPRDCQFDDD